MPAARLPRWANRDPPRGFAPRSAGRYTKPRGSPLLTTGTTSAVSLRGVNFARRLGVNIECRLTVSAAQLANVQEVTLAEVDTARDSIDRLAHALDHALVFEEDLAPGVLRRGARRLVGGIVRRLPDTVDPSVLPRPPGRERKQHDRPDGVAVKAEQDVGEQSRVFRDSFRPAPETAEPGGVLAGARPVQVQACMTARVARRGTAIDETDGVDQYRGEALLPWRTAMARAGGEKMRELEGVLHEAAGRLSPAHVAALVAHPDVVRSALAVVADVLTLDDEAGSRNRNHRGRRTCPRRRRRGGRANGGAFPRRRARDAADLGRTGRAGRAQDAPVGA